MEDDEQSIDGRSEHDYDISRLTAFSDGVFAVAITLLVFNVQVPAIAQNDALSRLPAALLETAPRLLTFALSSFLVGFYWIRHHQLFRQVVSADVWLLWLNLVVLFMVCLLPFSSGVVGRYHNTVIGAEVYAFNLALIAIAFSALYMYASRAQQVRPLPPGMGTGFFSQGLLLPIVVVALVMVLAPPSGDQANEAYLVGSVTPGAVSFVTDPSSKITITGGSGSILFSGKQYNWMIVWNNPANNTNQCASAITGGSMTHLIGIFYSPQCQVSITGGSGTSLDGQLVAYNVVITGGSGTAVNFNAGYLPRVAARITQ